MKMVRIFCISMLVLACVFFKAVVVQAGTVSEIMTKMEDLLDLQQDITAKIKLTQKKVDEGIKTMETLYYRRDQNDQFLMVFLAPETDKGNGYLRSGDNMWMYRRNTRTFQKLNRNDAIGGTDAKAGDFEKRKFTDLYAPVVDKSGTEQLHKETLGKAKIPIYRFEVKAKVKDVTYPKEIHWVRRDNFLTLKRESYALSGTLMQTSYFPKYTKISGRYIPLRMIFVDEFEKGNKTLIELSGISLKSIDKKVFTKAYLENLGK